jgi:ATP-dependent DNA ligase
MKKHSGGSLQYSESFRDADLAECRKRGLEGIVSKKRDAPYRSGKCDWMKIKCA